MISTAVSAGLRGLGNSEAPAAGGDAGPADLPAAAEGCGGGGGGICGGAPSDTFEGGGGGGGGGRPILGGILKVLGSGIVPQMISAIAQIKMAKKKNNPPPQPQPQPWPAPIPFQPQSPVPPQVNLQINSQTMTQCFPTQKLASCFPNAVPPPSVRTVAATVGVAGDLLASARARLADVPAALAGAAAPAAPDRPAALAAHPRPVKLRIDPQQRARAPCAGPVIAESQPTRFARFLHDRGGHWSVLPAPISSLLCHAAREPVRARRGTLVLKEASGERLSARSGHRPA